jgi:hypothetical protein
MMTRPPAAVEGTGDFPEGVDAMTVKEFRQGLRARTFVFPFVALQVFLLGTAVAEWLDWSDGEASWGMFQEWGRRYAIPFWVSVGGVMVVVIPMTRFFDLQQEFRGRNAELLVLSGMSRWRIVRGKWRVSVVLALLVLVSALPYLMLRYFYGGMEWGPNLLIGLGVVLNSAVVSALVIGVSALPNFFGRASLLAAAGGVVLLCVSGPLLGAVGTLNPGVPWFVLPLILANVGAVSVLLILLGLQLARVRLRTFEDPLDPSPSGQVIVLYLFVPALVGLPGLFSAGILSVVSSAFFAWIALTIDPAPDPNHRARYAQA